ncbi:hypothetical protein GKZ28_27815 [Clostridium chromiireducens]|uniref:Uncharacterized protein n=1 Tax=Clostridium chromiireducens TaxID=225345 RepID=A0A964W5F8_9CLOT|nr:hypothetical protein [Clostridium chromiireducens]MVX67419.1 hypothetical protein [Clostridium chromiireducens]
MISTNNPWKRSRMLKYIEKEIERIVIAVRPDGRFERKNHKCTQMVNRMNEKRSL